MNKNYRNEVGEKGEVMGFSWFPENCISLHPNVPFLFLAQSIIAWWYEKITVFHQRFPDYGNLPSFTQISKRVSWMPKQMSEFTVPWEGSLLSSPAGGGREWGRVFALYKDLCWLSEFSSKVLERDDMQDCTLLWELPGEAQRLHPINKKWDTRSVFLSQLSSSETVPFIRWQGRW